MNAFEWFRKLLVQEKCKFIQPEGFASKTLQLFGTDTFSGISTIVSGPETGAPAEGEGEASPPPKPKKLL